MGFARAFSVGLSGVEGHLVEVEAHLAQGLPGTVITGLPDTAVAEARDRVRAAVLNSGEAWPARRITVGLGPAWLRKHGSGHDVAVALAVLAGEGMVPPAELADRVFVGELGLDGRVRATRGVLPAVMAAARAGVGRAVVPAANLAEARLVPGVESVGVNHLGELLAMLRGGPRPEIDEPAVVVPDETPTVDLADVVGQELGRFAVEVAAAGGHHLALFGSPGTGKTMLAERLPGLLPPLSEQEALRVTAVHSVAGTLPAGGAMLTRRPYQAPHHTASVAALVGGGSGLAKPGAVSLAHEGVLFLDEAAEFATGVLDALRQPLERGEVTLARAHGTVRYPARFQLVVAANPCPCGAPRPLDCACSSIQLRRFYSRLTGPLLDRIDLQLTLNPVTPAALLADASWVEPSEVVAKRVASAREAAASRWSAEGWRLNAEVPGAALRGAWRLPRSVTAPLDRALDLGEISARGYDRVLRVAWSVSDLRGTDTPTTADVDEATALRLRRNR